MLLNSLILLLLSNAITSRRDKSILYSRTTITILKTTITILFSSLLSLVIGTVVGLTQSRIKRLFAFSTISHVGFILLGLSIHTVESTQAFMFYLIQYSISNLNAFMLIITIGYSLYCYVNNEESTGNVEKNTFVQKVHIKMKNIVISSSVSLSISVITLFITLFIFIPEELLSLANILALILFNL